MTRIRLPIGTLVLVLLAASSWSCSRSGGGVPDEDLGGLVLAPTDVVEDIDVERLAIDPDELVRAAELPLSHVVATLGAHRYKSRVETRVFEGEAGEVEVEALEVTTGIESAADGTFHALTENSKEYGYEVYFVGGDLYLAPRYSRFHRRAPERDAEPDAIRDEIYGELSAHLKLVARGIDVEASGDGVTPGGRSTRTIAIAKAPGMRRDDDGKSQDQEEVLEHRKWRESIIVKEASGELEVDGETGIVLRGALRGAVSFERDGRQFTMSFEVSHALEDIGATIAIEAPPEDRWVTTPLRLREVEERDLLLDGIAPPTRVAPPEMESGNASESGATNTSGKDGTP